MNRRQPLQRRTRLRSKTPLRPKAQLQARTTIQRRTPINKVSAKRTADNRKRTPIVNALREAQRGRCARCRRTGLQLDGHERLERSHGGDILAPECALCRECNTWASNEKRIAAWTGWIICAKYPHDPALSSSQAVDLFGALVDFTVPDGQVA